MGIFLIAMTSLPQRGLIVPIHGNHAFLANRSQRHVVADCATDRTGTATAGERRAVAPDLTDDEARRSRRGVDPNGAFDACGRGRI